MSHDDYCVYARNILGRLDRIPNPTTHFSSDVIAQTSSSMGQSNEVNMGLVMMGAMIVLFLIMSFLKRKQPQPESKLE